MTAETVFSDDTGPVMNESFGGVSPLQSQTESFGNLPEGALKVRGLGESPETPINTKWQDVEIIHSITHAAAAASCGAFYDPAAHCPDSTPGIQPGAGHLRHRCIIPGVGR